MEEGVALVEPNLGFWALGRDREGRIADSLDDPRPGAHARIEGGPMLGVAGVVVSEGDACAGKENKRGNEPDHEMLPQHTKLSYAVLAYKAVAIWVVARPLHHRLIMHAIGSKLNESGQERRSEDRWLDYAGCVVAVDGRVGKLIDVSASGARFVFNYIVAPGTTLIVDLPWGKTVRGKVISCEFSEIRMKFDFPIDQPW
jgi:hypothetical protein